MSGPRPYYSPNPDQVEKQQKNFEIGDEDEVYQKKHVIKFQEDLEFMFMMKIISL